MEGPAMAKSSDTRSGTKRTRALHRLTAKQVGTLPGGAHHDGGGLYLLVDDGSRSWAFRYSFDGKEKRIGLGSAANVSLADARDTARSYRALVATGTDPKAQREADRTATQSIAAVRSSPATRCARDGPCRQRGASRPD
jgi:Arm domain-containing DNA-binding protein